MRNLFRTCWLLPLLAAPAFVFSQDERPRPGVAAQPRRFAVGRQAALAQNPLIRLLDADGDGQISAEEIAAAPLVLAKLDKNDDGALSREELAAVMRSAGGGGRPGEINTPAAKGERISDKLVVGDKAPDFTLPFVSGKEKLTLSSFRDKRPVVLIFASYT